MLVVIPAVLVVVFLTASYFTRGVMEHRAFVNGRAGKGSELVDQTPWQTAAGLAPSAVSAEERAFAQQAERLADHEVDQAFAMALRQAELETRVLTGPALQLQQKVNALGQMVKEDQARVDGLTAQAAAATRDRGAAADSLSNDLDAARAQLQLDSDELNDAQDDLARASGDRRADIQQELNAREEQMKKYDSQLNGGEIAVVSAQRYGTLAGRVNGWLGQIGRRKLLEQARAEADSDVANLRAEHARIEQRSDAVTAKIRGTDQAGLADADSAKRGSRLAQAHALAQIHSILDDRIATEQQLADVYGKWAAQVQLQHGIVGHLILDSLAGVSGIVLLGMLLWWGVQALVDRAEDRGLGFDPRNLHTMRTVVSLGIQLLTMVVLLVAIFGAPKQMPTILGLGAAGLTVVFQDFILAFFGWFVLMGRNGIRVGDWVEVNGVGGEVVDIGLFRTAVLETGNWTDKGHPTGRRVTFMNSFAVTGSYFNFSTAGQWMWDEISLNVPPGEDSYRTIEAIQKAVAAETATDAELAEAEWRTATKVRGLSQFSAAPSVDLRPAASGIEVIVRYVTRAGSRFEMRNKLYGTLMGVLHQQEVTGIRA